MVATASAASAQTVSHTFQNVDCTAVVNGVTIHQSQNIDVSITAPDSVTPGSSFTIVFPGGSSMLPTQSSGFTITSYSNIALVYQVNNATFTSGTIVNPGTAQLIKANTTTAVDIVHAVSLPASNHLQGGEPGPFSPGTPPGSATLITPDISVDATAPSSGSVTLNALSLTTTVKLNGTYTSNVNCDIPQDILITIPVAAANTPPTVDAGSDVSGNTGAAIALDATVTDPDDTPTTAWTIDTGNCTFADPTAVDTTVTCSTPGVFTATLTADDGHNSPVSDTAQVTVNAVANTPPTVDAGSDVSGNTGAAIALDATVTDPDDTPTTQWTANDAGCSFADPAAVDTTVTCTSPGTFTATLTADDGHNAPVSDSAEVSVTDVTPPSCSGLCASIGDATTYENGVLAFAVTLNQPVPVDSTINATIGGGTATNGYKLPCGSLYDYKVKPDHVVKLKAGHFKAFVNVRTFADSLDTEGTETVNVTLTDSTGATIQLDRSVGTGTILDSTAIGPNQLLVGESLIVRGATGEKVTGKVAVVLSQPSGSDVAVTYSTSSTGLVAKTDYGAKVAKTLTFKAGQTRKFVTVVVVGSSSQSGNQSIDFTFSNPTGGAALDYGDVGTVTILPASDLGT